MKATMLTGSDLDDMRDLLKPHRRDELVAKMSPERRALYQRILRRREAIGAVKHDITDALRELRANG